MIEEVPEKFLSLSRNELVSIAREVGSTSAHRGMSVEELAAVIADGTEGEDPLDGKRREIMTWLSRHDGMIVATCHGNCFLHSWAKVVQCRRLIPGGDEE